MVRTPSSPRRKLFWFKRLRALAPGSSKDVLVEAPANGVHLSAAVSDGTRWLAPGAFTVEVGVHTADTLLTQDVVLTGSRLMLKEV